MNNLLDEVVKLVFDAYGVEIKNKSHDDIILFDVCSSLTSINPELAYSGITDDEHFEITFPSLYLRGDRIEEFCQRMEMLKNIANLLNVVILEYKKTLNHKEVKNDRCFKQCEYCGKFIDEIKMQFCKNCKFFPG